MLWKYFVLLCHLFNQIRAPKDPVCHAVFVSSSVSGRHNEPAIPVCIQWYPSIGGREKHFYFLNVLQLSRGFDIVGLLAK